LSVSPNPAATEHLPFFITPPGETDVLYNVTLVFVIAMIVLAGVLFLTIHSLPERIAHKTKKIQLDIVAVLGLLALLTNEHVFWFAALLLAYIDFPDFLTPITRIATAAETIAAQENTDTSLTGHPEPSPPKAVAADQLPKDKKGAVHA
jgi:multisubunit Na+/H+ antiporter MnhF subunit